MMVAVLIEPRVGSLIMYLTPIFPLVIPAVTMAYIKFSNHDELSYDEVRLMNCFICERTTFLFGIQLYAKIPDIKTYQRLFIPMRVITLTVILFGVSMESVQRKEGTKSHYFDLFDQIAALICCGVFQFNMVKGQESMKELHEGHK